MKILMLGLDKSPSLPPDTKIIKPNFLINKLEDYEDVKIYASKVVHFARKNNFDLVHCYNWMSYLAGVDVKRKSKKPLVLNVNDTVFDRHKNIDNIEYEIEKNGFENADKIIVSSNRTKDILVNKYKTNPEKIDIAYNFVKIKSKNLSKDKTVLFLCKAHKHKDINYFLNAARWILKFEPSTKFFVVCSKENLPQIINKSLNLLKDKKLVFVDYSNKKEIALAFDAADIVVASSVVENILARAINNNIPIITSKSSSVAEVSNNLKLDLSDVNELVNKVVSIVRHDSLYSEIVYGNILKTKSLNSGNYANKIVEIYKEAMKKW